MKSPILICPAILVALVLIAPCSAWDRPYDPYLVLTSNAAGCVQQGDIVQFQIQRDGTTECDAPDCEWNSVKFSYPKMYFSFVSLDQGSCYTTEEDPGEVRFYACNNHGTSRVYLRVKDTTAFGTPMAVTAGGYFKDYYHYPAWGMNAVQKSITTTVCSRPYDPYLTLTATPSGCLAAGSEIEYTVAYDGTPGCDAPDCEWKYVSVSYPDEYLSFVSKIDGPCWYSEVVPGEIVFYACENDAFSRVRFAVLPAAGYDTPMVVTANGKFEDLYHFPNWGKSAAPVSLTRTTCPEQKIQVIVPNGGESWPAGTSQTITWTATGLGDWRNNVHIDLWKNWPVGIHVLDIAATVPADDGAYTWTIPAGLTPSDRYWVNITSIKYPSVFDYTNGWLEISKPVIAFPGEKKVPTDSDGDGIYEDLNGNGRLDFADVVMYFNQMEWIAANEPVPAFDLNRNGRIDFADVVALFNEI